MSVKLGDKVKQGSVFGHFERWRLRCRGLRPRSDQRACHCERSEAPSRHCERQLLPSGLAVTESVIASEAKQSTGLPQADGLRNDAGLPHASPSVRKFARELGVPLQ